MIAPRRMIRSRVFDSARWGGYQPRGDDIIIGTYSKCGTTWVQRIVGMLVFQSAAPRSILNNSPWFDMRVFGPIGPDMEAAERQTHRRFLKTHLPLDALPIYPGVKFIHVTRDGRDAALSLHNHLFNFTAKALEAFDAISRADPKFGDAFPRASESPAEFFAEWVTDGGAMGDPGASFFHVETSYWEASGEPNFLFLHYNDLKADLGGEMRRVAEFLEIKVAEPLWSKLIAAASFNTMRTQGDTLLPRTERIFEGGSSRFLHRGSNGRWQEVFRKSDLARYDAAVKAKVHTQSRTLGSQWPIAVTVTAPLRMLRNCEACHAAVNGIGHVQHKAPFMLTCG